MAATLEKFCAPGVYDTPVEVSSRSHPDYLIEVEAIAIL